MNIVKVEDLLGYVFFGKEGDAMSMTARGMLCATLALLLAGAVWVSDAAAGTGVGIVGEPPPATATASLASGRFCITIPDPPWSINDASRSSVTHGLRAWLYDGYGTARVGRYCPAYDISIGVGGTRVHYFGSVSLGETTCLNVTICGEHAIGKTFHVDIEGKVSPRKPKQPVGDNWTNQVTRSPGYTASFKPAGHCYRNVSFYGGPHFATVCRVGVTITADDDGAPVDVEGLVVQEQLAPPPQQQIIEITSDGGTPESDTSDSSTPTQVVAPDSSTPDSSTPGGGTPGGSTPTQVVAPDGNAPTPPQSDCSARVEDGEQGGLSISSGCVGPSTTSLVEISSGSQYITVELSVTGEQEPAADEVPSIILSSSLLKEIETVSFDLSVPSEGLPEGLSLEGFAAEVGIGDIMLEEDETVTVCLPASFLGSKFYRYEEDDDEWTPLPVSTRKTVNGVESVCADLSSSSLPSLFGVFVEVSETPVMEMEEEAGGGCSVVSDGEAGSGLFNLLLVMFSLLAFSLRRRMFGFMK
ncbi:MAG: hypothetical protein F4X32_03040 [Candidatus Dadabacteria bacterium]|nr:hypothetical protein [Candidatus Dadabacteria bacterium]